MPFAKKKAAPFWLSQAIKSHLVLVPPLFGGGIPCANWCSAAEEAARTLSLFPALHLVMDLSVCFPSNCAAFTGE